jgi:hypothetical protein
MVDYQVAIPSYRRADVLKKNTLATLERYGVSDDRIHVFVADEQELLDYRQALGERYNLVVGALGKVEQQKFYNAYFEPGTPLLNMDDDIADVLELNAQGKLSPSRENMQKIVDIGFALCEKYGAKMWGLNPVSNGFFMRHEATVGLRFLIGNFFGNYAGDLAISGADREMQCDSGDDWLTTVRSFLEHGRIVRIEWLNAKTRMFAKGGIEAQLSERGIERKVKHHEELTRLAAMFPDLLTVTTKAGGVTNLRLRLLTEAKVPKGLAITMG